MSSQTGPGSYRIKYTKEQRAVIQKKRKEARRKAKRKAALQKTAAERLLKEKLEKKMPK